VKAEAVKVAVPKANATDFFAPKQEVKVAAKKPAVDQKAVEQLLLHVARGEQKEAKALAKKQPELLCHKGTVTDYSNRRFENITAFQYALWALDWHMWSMLLSYLPKEEASAQLHELESKGTRHGVHYDFTPLTQALKTYIDNYHAWSVEQCKAHWCKVVGGAQTQVPAHVANEYCREDRSFDPTPKFTEKSLPRVLMHDEGAWYPVARCGSYGVLGVDFGIVRGHYGGLLQACGYAGGRCDTGRARMDFSALAELCKTRTAQLADLKRQLEPVSARRLGAS
jgi:hypothetical protein